MAAYLNNGSLKGGKAEKVMNFLHEMGIGATSQRHGTTPDLLEKETKVRSETEITRLKEAVKKLEAEKEAGLVQFYRLLKKASDLESRVVGAEEESRVLKQQACLEKKLLEAKEDREVEVCILSEKLRSLENTVHERFHLEIEKTVVIGFVEGIAYEAHQLLLKNAVLQTEKEFLISQVKELRELIEGLKRELGQTLDENEASALEKSVLVWLFKELKLEAYEEHKVILENFANESRKVLVLQESYHNLETQMAKLVEENTVLKKDFLHLKQQNHASCEDIIHRSEIQLHGTEQNHAQIHPEAVDDQLMKETKLDRIITIEKAVDYMKRFSASDDLETKTLADEFRAHSYTIDDHRRVCKIQHSTPHETHFGMKVFEPRKGSSSVKSVEDDVNGEVLEDGKEKKHKNRFGSIGKKLIPKKYRLKSRQVTHQGELEGRKKSF